MSEKQDLPLSNILLAEDILFKKLSRSPTISDIFERLLFNCLRGFRKLLNLHSFRKLR